MMLSPGIIINLKDVMQYTVLHWRLLQRAKLAAMLQLLAAAFCPEAHGNSRGGDPRPGLPPPPSGDPPTPSSPRFSKATPSPPEGVKHGPRVPSPAIAMNPSLGQPHLILTPLTNRKLVRAISLARMIRGWD
jgi:hypothetical protein